MIDGYVRTDIQGGIASVTFHPPRSNSLPGHILRSMAQAIEAAGADRTVRVIVLRSEGEKAFCAGASFDELIAIDSEAKGLAFFSGFAQVINAIRKVPVFVLGRIHAHTVGGGTGLACAVDIAYAHSGASARLSELAIGIGPFVVGPAVERKVGTGTFGTMAATPAIKRDSSWCERHGIFAEVFPTIEALDGRVNAHAAELATYSPEAMADIKRMLWKGTEHWDAFLAERAATSGRLVLSDFTKNAIERFKTEAGKR
ncbi:MAG: enoyl-CoA hydratase/isomerase family protein [Flavobacteriales bacterium]|nr:enoyl-CoA hydratase/isomerase family protein [Flavobacteriales bacterium]